MFSLQTYLSVGPLSLRVDGAVALGVLTGRLGLWRVPLEGAAKLKTLVLCWHGDAEPREALGVQVGLHARRHAVGALEASPPATQARSHPVTQSIARKSFSPIIFLLIIAHSCLSRVSHAVTAVTTIHSIWDKSS